MGCTAISENCIITSHGVSFRGSRYFDPSDLPNRKEVDICKQWIEENGAGANKAPSARGLCSYGWKHVIERRVKSYISNGSLIQAVYELGLPIKTRMGDINCLVGLKNPKGPKDVQKYLGDLVSDKVYGFSPSFTKLKDGRAYSEELGFWLPIEEAAESTLSTLSHYENIKFDLGEVWKAANKNKASRKEFCKLLEAAMQRSLPSE